MKHRKRRSKAPPFHPTPASLLGDAILLFAGLSGAVLSVTTAFSLQVFSPMLLAGCGVCTAVSLLIWALPRRWWALPLAGAAAFWGLALWRLWDLLVLGEISLRCSVVNTFCASMALDGYIEPIAQLPQFTWTLVTTVLVLMAMLPLSLLLGLAILRVRSFWFTFWVTFPFPLAPVCISVTPAWPAMCALLLVWCVMGLTSLVGRQDRRRTTRLTLAALPAVALLLALLTVAMPQEDYQRPQWADDALDSLNNWAAHLDIGLFNSGGLFGLFGSDGSFTDADGQVSLSDTGPLRYTGRTVLEVDTDLRGRIYLRGFSSAVYDGSSWGPLDTRDYQQLGGLAASSDPDALGLSNLLGGFQPLNFPALADRSTFPDKQYAQYTVRNVGADPGYVYVPYHILSQPDELSGCAFMEDSYLARADGVWTHTLYIQPDCDPLSGSSTPISAWSAEQTYSAFVDRCYLAIPSDTITALEPVMEDLWYNLTDSLTGGTDNPAYQAYLNLLVGSQSYDETWERAVRLATANLVAAYLDSVAEYDPDTPTTPEGEDFVAYFLTESHRGYCMHFASAATLILRSLGVPARYVTGYVADVPSSGHVDVPDSAAHAWVEIYLTGYGWEPVEVTPTYTGSTPGQSATEKTEPTATAEPTPTTPQSTRTPQVSTQPSAAPSQAPDGETEDGPSFDLRLLLIPLCVLLVLLAFLLRRAARRVLRRRRLAQKDPNRAVIAAYLYLRRTERWGVPVPDEIFELAKKAKFSPHTLTESERAQAAAAVRDASFRLERSLPWYKRLWCRYILGLW